jgi:hypothetical protein
MAENKRTEAQRLEQANEEATLRANGRSIELKIEIASGSRSPFGIRVFASPDGQA